MKVQFGFFCCKDEVAISFPALLRKSKQQKKSLQRHHSCSVSGHREKRIIRVRHMGHEAL
jgi:hypothetical protein